MFILKRNTDKDKNNIKKKAPFYFYIILFSIPFAFLLLMELSLTAFGYGKKYDQWIEVVPGKLMLNPEIARRYFYRNTSLPRPMRDLFNKAKSANSFRVFILGESCAAGFPYYPTSSFSRYLERRLEAEYAYSKIEVVNTGITAISSYALRDLMPGVLEEKPDLLIIYAGNNEYYGALGAASTLALGRSRLLINSMLYLERFKSVQLLSDAVSFLFRLFRKDRHFGIACGEVSKEREVPYNSSLFKAGVNQFEGNLKDILSMAREAKVPVILGTLVCNLKDQPPFISSDSGEFPPAERVYIEGVNRLKSQEFRQADSLFRLARDLDILRFRAPEKMNLIIKSLAGQFGYEVVKFDSVFNSISSEGITGNDLMADHLHPNIFGYQVMGQLLFEKMKQKGLIPRARTSIAGTGKQKSF